MAEPVDRYQKVADFLSRTKRFRGLSVKEITDWLREFCPTEVGLVERYRQCCALALTLCLRSGGPVDVADPYDPAGILDHEAAAAEAAAA